MPSLPGLRPARRGRAGAGLVVLLALASCATQPTRVVPGGSPEPTPPGSAGPAPTVGPTGSPAPTASAAPVPTSPAAGPSPGPSATPPGGKARRATGYAGERVAVRMPMGDYNGIVGEMDNVTSVNLEGGDNLSEAARASALFTLVGNQVPGNPPAGSTVTITLSRAQWGFVVDELRDSIPVYREIDMPEEAESAAATIDLVQRQLAAATTASAPAPGPTAPTHHHGRADDHEFYLMPFNADAVERLPSPSNRLIDVTPTGAIVLYSGRTFADVDLTVQTLSVPPAPLADSIGAWEVGEEETVRIPEPLHGFSPFTEWYAQDLFVPARPGLYRVRVLARGRVHDEPEDYPEIPDDRVTEHVEVAFWPVHARQPNTRAGSDAVP